MHSWGFNSGWCTGVQTWTLLDSVLWQNGRQLPHSLTLHLWHWEPQARYPHLADTVCSGTELFSVHVAWLQAGSVHVRIRRDADEQMVLAHVFNRLGNLISVLTVHIFKDDWARPSAYQILGDSSLFPASPGGVVTSAATGSPPSPPAAAAARPSVTAASTGRDGACWSGLPPQPWHDTAVLSAGSYTGSSMGYAANISEQQRHQSSAWTLAYWGKWPNSSSRVRTKATLALCTWVATS